MADPQKPNVPSNQITTCRIPSLSALMLIEKARAPQFNEPLRESNIYYCRHRYAKPQKVCLLYRPEPVISCKKPIKNLA